MRYFLLLLSLLAFNNEVLSQTEYMPGYFIDIDGNKTECLIKNEDWKNNPYEFEYKASENASNEIKTIQNVTEFGSGSAFKYVSANVKIDRSSDNIRKLSREKSPMFSEETVFLKVLIEGDANLYVYFDGNIKRYFYNIGDSEVEQLIYKKYKSDNNDLKYNNQYKQQLYNAQKCSIKEQTDQLKYSRNSLTKFIKKINQCEGNTFVDYTAIKKDLFNLNLRPRIHNAGMYIVNNQSEYRETDFGRKTGIGFGVEAEFILPFNNNKFAFLIEANYQTYKATVTTEESRSPGGILIAEVDYKPIEIPIGIRYYHFLNEGSKLFANVSFVTDISNNSTITYKGADDYLLSETKIDFIQKYAFGIGYKLKNKISAELRYKKSRSLLGNNLAWRNSHNTISMIFGYSLL